MSAISDGSTVHTATDQTADKKPRYSVGSVASSIHTKSAVSIHEDLSSDNDSESSVHTESTLKSHSIQQSVKSNQQFTEDEKGLPQQIIFHTFSSIYTGICRWCLYVGQLWLDILQARIFRVYY